MILVRVDDTIINMQNIQAIVLVGSRIEFEIPGDMYYSKEYASKQEAEAAYEKLFTDLASISGVDGAILN